MSVSSLGWGALATLVGGVEGGEELVSCEEGAGGSSLISVRRDGSVQMFSQELPSLGTKSGQ